MSSCSPKNPPGGGVGGGMYIPDSRDIDMINTPIGQIYGWPNACGPAGPAGQTNVRPPTGEWVLDSRPNGCSFYSLTGAPRGSGCSSMGGCFGAGPGNCLVAGQGYNFRRTAFNANKTDCCTSGFKNVAEQTNRRYIEQSGKSLYESLTCDPSLQNPGSDGCLQSFSNFCDTDVNSWASVIDSGGNLRGQSKQSGLCNAYLNNTSPETTRQFIKTLSQKYFIKNNISPKDVVQQTLPVPPQPNIGRLQNYFVINNNNLVINNPPKTCTFVLNDDGSIVANSTKISNGNFTWGNNINNCPINYKQILFYTDDKTVISSPAGCSFVYIQDDGNFCLGDSKDGVYWDGYSHYNGLPKLNRKTQPLPINNRIQIDNSNGLKIYSPCGNSFLALQNDGNIVFYRYDGVVLFNYYLSVPSWKPAMNTDFYGNDIRAIPNVLPATCQQICSTEDGCVGFVTDSNAFNTPGMCWLKSALPVESKTSNNQRTSYLRPTGLPPSSKWVEANMDYPGNDITGGGFYPTLCPVGTEYRGDLGGRCFGTCAEGWWRTTPITCQQGGRAWTDPGRFGDKGAAACPPGSTERAGLCYWDNPGPIPGITDGECAKRCENNPSCVGFVTANDTNTSFGDSVPYYNQPKTCKLKSVLKNATPTNDGTRTYYKNATPKTRLDYRTEAISGIQTLPGGWGYLSNTDSPYFDIGPGGGFSGSSVADCANRCSANKECTSFVVDGGPVTSLEDTRQRTCWTKFGFNTDLRRNTSNRNVLYKPVVILSDRNFQIENNANSPSGDITHFDELGIEDCAAKCQVDPNCRGFVVGGNSGFSSVFNGSGSCWLKSSISNIISEPNTSVVKKI